MDILILKIAIATALVCWLGFSIREYRSYDEVGFSGITRAVAMGLLTAMGAFALVALIGAAVAFLIWG